MSRRSSFEPELFHRDCSIEIDKTTPFVTLPELNPNPTYHKRAFLDKLSEMGLENDWATSVMRRLGKTFLLDELDKSIQQAASDATFCAYARRAANFGVHALAG